MRIVVPALDSRRDIQLHINLRPGWNSAGCEYVTAPPPGVEHAATYLEESLEGTGRC
jgi:hypothetical protein